MTGGAGCQRPPGVIGEDDGLSKTTSLVLAGDTIFAGRVIGLLRPVNINPDKFVRREHFFPPIKPIGHQFAILHGAEINTRHIVLERSRGAPSIQ